MDSIEWRKAILHYPYRGLAPEIFASRLKAMRFCRLNLEDNVPNHNVGLINTHAQHLLEVMTYHLKRLPRLWVEVQACRTFTTVLLRLEFRKWMKKTGKFPEKGFV